MFNLLYPFTKDVLTATVKRGGLWFVRNTLQPLITDDKEIKPGFLITHYNDEARASTHFDITSEDPHRYLYKWADKESMKKLELAASQPAGYRIFSAYFFPDYKKRISKQYKEKINRYMYTHTDWKPAGSQTVHVDLYLQFGHMYLHLKFEGEELKIKFADIEKTK